MFKKKENRRRVTFSLVTHEAKDVRLTGTFNNWDINKHPMKTKKDGVWTKTVMIPPGIYEYKFLVDDEWRHDYTNDHVTYNEHGTLNSLIVVE
jgi:1,4-alpha-glucan branching enzyme